MTSFGDDLKRLAGEIVNGREKRITLISGICTRGRESRTALNAGRGNMLKSMRTRAAQSAAARRAERSERSADVLDFRETLQALIRSDMANLRKTLGDARQNLAGNVGTLRATMRTVHAKTSTDLLNQIGADLTQLRGDMRRQFAAARSTWRGDAEVAGQRAASSSAAAPPKTKSSATGGQATPAESAAPRPNKVPGTAAAPAFAAPVARKDTVAPPANAGEVATMAKAPDPIQRVA